MEIKKILGVVLVVAGLLSLVPGVLAIFEGGDVLGLNPWALTILGLLFFGSGIGLMKSLGNSPEA